MAVSNVSRIHRPAKPWTSVAVLGVSRQSGNRIYSKSVRTYFTVCCHHPIISLSRGVVQDKNGVRHFILLFVPFTSITSLSTSRPNTMHILTQPSSIQTCFGEGCPPSSRKTTPHTKTHRCLEVFFFSCTYKFISRTPSTQSCLFHTSHVCMVCGVFSLTIMVAVIDTCRKISFLYQCVNIIGSFDRR
jgi:hypothetical protein